MSPRAWPLYAALLAACVATILAARPFRVNATALRQTLPQRGGSATPLGGKQGGGRRRARDAGAPQSTPQPPNPFWANASLVGQEAACDAPAWKTCLRVGRLLHEASGRCFEAGDLRPCGPPFGRVLALDRDALRADRLRSVCLDNDCPTPSPFMRRMAFDGACYTMPEVLGRVCAGASRLVPHVLGGWECSCTRKTCPAAREVAQPEVEGRCALPDFRSRVPDAFRVRCSATEAACLGQGKLPFGDGCHAPLSSAACPAGQRLVLRLDAARAERLLVECAPAQPCGSGEVLLHADGRCHARSEITHKLCPDDFLAETPAGDIACLKRNLNLLLASQLEGDTCRLLVVAS